NYQTRISLSLQHDFWMYRDLQAPNVKAGIVGPSASTLSCLWGHWRDISSDSTAIVSAYFDQLLDLIVTGIWRRKIEYSIELIYQIEEPEAVAEFLNNNVFLNELLVEAHAKIAEFFGSETKVHLELIDDQDYWVTPKLYAVILTQLTAMKAMPIQERLDNE